MGSNLKWYVVHTYSGYEEKAKAALLERVKNVGLEDKFGDIVIPSVSKETVTKSGKKKTTSKTQYPGYIIIQMDLNDVTRVLVKETPRITGFIGNQRSPRPLPDREVIKLTAPENIEEQKISEPEIIFEKGETVKVIEGPFNNFDGVVDEVKPDKFRLRVLVSIFGRETPVELEYKQVEKI